MATMTLTRNNAKNTTKRIWAMLDAVAAIPAKPKIAAMMAITRNVRAQPSMVLSLSFLSRQSGSRGWQRKSAPESSRGGGSSSSFGMWETRQRMIICRLSRAEDESLNGIRNAFEFDRTIETARDAIQQQPCGAFLLDRKLRAHEPLDG